MPFIKTTAPGIGACILVALVAMLLGAYVPIVGGPVFAMAIGVAMTLVRGPLAVLEPGVRFASRNLLQWSIILLGAHLSVTQIAQGGARSFPVMVGTLVIVLIVAFVAGGMLGLDRDLRRLLGIGTAICGGSAIAAVSTVIEADQADVAYALGAVFLFNIVAIVIFPPLGHLLQLSQPAFGLWAGTAINDTSSVVAAAFSYGHVAGSQAVIVKLTRTTLIIPIVLFYAWRRARFYREQGEGVAWAKVIPWFIGWFILAALWNSFGLIPAALQAPIQNLALFLIVVALAGVGLSSDIEKMKSAGLRPLLLGAILWVTIAVSSLVIAHVAHLE